MMTAAHFATFMQVSGYISLVAACCLLAMATWSAGVASVHWYRNRHDTVETILEGDVLSADGYQALAGQLGVSSGCCEGVDVAQFFAPAHGGYPSAVRTIHIRPITPSKAEMIALRASAQAAADEHGRTGQAVTNPYPAGSRKGIVWATFYLDAQMTREWHET